MSTITIHNKEYRIYEVTGKILESNKQRELRGGPTCLNN